MWFGTEGDYNVMVVELLGPSLQDLFSYSAHQFDVHTTLLLARQIVNARHDSVVAQSEIRPRERLHPPRPEA